jgi:hypothetical protein
MCFVLCSDQNGCKMVLCASQGSSTGYSSDERY